MVNFRAGLPSLVRRVCGTAKLLFLFAESQDSDSNDETKTADSLKFVGLTHHADGHL